MRGAGLLVLVAVVTACGGSADEGASASNGGVGGSAGTAAGTAGAGGGGAGGSSGAAGASGSSGTAGVGGGSGTAGAGGSGGTAGNAGAGAVNGRECSSDADCTLFSDCCTCAGLANGESADECLADCNVDKCAWLGIAGAVCRAGRCATSADCDPSTVVCKSLPPECELSDRPVVAGDCWAGGCIRATECERVDTCLVCNPKMFACVVNASPSGDIHCVDPKPCTGDPSCGCLASSVCSGQGCTEGVASHEIDCVITP